MPTYGYRCPGCGHEFEELQKMNDNTRVKCPKCGKRGERLISGGAGVVFKGSGFYETDYKRAKPKDTEKKSADGSSPSKPGEKSKEKSPSSGKEKTPKKGDES